MLTARILIARVNAKWHIFQLTKSDLTKLPEERINSIFSAGKHVNLMAINGCLEQMGSISFGSLITMCKRKICVMDEFGLISQHFLIKFKDQSIRIFLPNTETVEK